MLFVVMVMGGLGDSVGGRNLEACAQRKFGTN